MAMSPIRVELIGGQLDGLVMDVSGPILRIPRERKVSIVRGPTASYEYVTIPCVVYAGFLHRPGRTPAWGMTFRGWE